MNHKKFVDERHIDVYWHLKTQRRRHDFGNNQTSRGEKQCMRSKLKGDFTTLEPTE